MNNEYEFNEEMWEYPGQAAWHFINLPKTYTADIKELSTQHKRGFGSVRVNAQIGQTKWNTSIFPDSKSRCYMLPVKKEVRKSNNLKAGQKVTVLINIDLTNY